MKCAALIRLLRQDGWYVVSQKGSHVKMRHATKAGIIVVPNHDSKEIATGTAARILIDAGLTR